MTSSSFAVLLWVGAALQGCCVAGFESTPRMAWQSANAGGAAVDAAATLNACTREADGLCEQQVHAACTRVVATGGKVRVISGIDDQEIVGDARKAEVLAHCRTMVSDPAALTRQCVMQREPVQACMRQRGFVQGETTELSCKPMRLF